MSDFTNEESEHVDPNEPVQSPSAPADVRPGPVGVPVPHDDLDVPAPVNYQAPAAEPAPAPDEFPPAQPEPGAEVGHPGPASVFDPGPADKVAEDPNAWTADVPSASQEAPAPEVAPFVAADGPVKNEGPLDANQDKPVE